MFSVSIHYSSQYYPTCNPLTLLWEFSIGSPMTSKWLKSRGLLSPDPAWVSPIVYRFDHSYLCLDTLLANFYAISAPRMPLIFSGCSFSFSFADLVFSTQSLHVKSHSRHFLQSFPLFTPYCPYTLPLIPWSSVTRYFFVTFTYKTVAEAS